MGEVYRATDTNLKRQVAIKVLPAAVAADADRLARFQREAEVLASLNHPHIAHIHGLEKSGGTIALVMELVEGEDLSQRITRGAVPLAEALPIGKQIAEALEAAHEQGIIHRDLKPANIKVRGDGTVKVLDFGLAKAMDPAGASSAEAMNSPTLTARATEMGMILGTAAYMAPEQAKGKSVDKRADIWAFGVVLYEMLTGRRAFTGDDVSETLASVLKDTPPMDALPPGTPPRLTRLIARCLDRDLKTRLRDIGEARIEIARIEAGAPDSVVATVAAAAATPRSNSQRVLPWVFAGALAIVAAALAVPALRHLREASPATHVTTLNLDLAPADRLGPTLFNGRPALTAFAIAPDGATIVFVGESIAPGGSRTTMLYRRLLADATTVAIPGSEGAAYPFFSPDGQWVGFAAGDKLKKVALSGGPPIELCDADGFLGASWGSAGVIAFSSNPNLRTVSDSGGTPNPPVEPVPHSRSRSLAMLPDGKTVLVTELAGDKWDEAHVDAIDLTTKQRKTLLTNAADARYSPTGHLVFMRNAALLAVPFDATRVEITGAPVPVLAGVMQSINAPVGTSETGMGQFALSTSGTLIFAAGDRFPSPASTLLRVNRKGGETKLAQFAGALIGLRLSPSGSRAVVAQTRDGSRVSNLWMLELATGTPTRLTATGEAIFPMFSPDGKSVTFADFGTSPGIYSLPLGTTNPPQLLMDAKDPLGLYAASWSPDGKWLAYLEPVKSAGRNLQIFVRAVRDAKLDGEPRQFSPSTFVQADPKFSPDGRWIVYTSNESGVLEVYVQPFLGPGEKHRISSSGGTNPTWSKNGRELFYLRVPSASSTASMMAVDVSTAADFKAGVPHLLFEGPYNVTRPLRSYDVTADGQFIMSRQQLPPDQPVTRLTVVLGWAETLKARVPAAK